MTNRSVTNRSTVCQTQYTRLSTLLYLSVSKNKPVSQQQWICASLSGISHTSLLTLPHKPFNALTPVRPFSHRILSKLMLWFVDTRTPVCQFIHMSSSTITHQYFNTPTAVCERRHKICQVPINRLVGLVVRCPPRERKIPDSNPACAGIFSGSSHTSDLKIGTPVAGYPAKCLAL